MPLWKKKRLNECPLEFKPKFYRRYVDDTFLIFESPQHIPLFLNYLNSKHPNIAFTCDMETDGSIPFLDVLVTRAENRLPTAVYRKPTFTGLGINYLSFIVELFKVNAIKTLLLWCGLPVGTVQPRCWRFLMETRADKSRCIQAEVHKEKPWDDPLSVLALETSARLWSLLRVPGVQ